MADLGILPLTNPPSSACKLDIVAIHGLNGHRIHTWTKEAKDRNDGRVNWLEDFLPVDLKEYQPRVMTFGYDAKLWLSPTVAGLEEWTSQLLQSLARVRQGVDPTRPIIFICHSLGGIVFKAAVNRAHQEAPSHDSLLAVISGVMFLGTPHRGGNYAHIFRALTPGLGRLVNLRSVKLSENGSQRLWEVDRDFRYRAVDLKAIATVYETGKNVVAFDPVVDKESAILGLPNETDTALSEKHQDLCRFLVQKSESYQQLIHSLKELVRKVFDEVPDGVSRSGSRRRAPPNSDYLSSPTPSDYPAAPRRTTTKSTDARSGQRGQGPRRAVSSQSLRSRSNTGGSLPRTVEPVTGVQALARPLGHSRSTYGLRATSATQQTLSPERPSLRGSRWSVPPISYYGTSDAGTSVGGSAIAVLAASRSPPPQSGHRSVAGVNSSLSTGPQRPPPTVSVYDTDMSEVTSQVFLDQSLPTGLVRPHNPGAHDLDRDSFNDSLAAVERGRQHLHRKEWESAQASFRDAKILVLRSMNSTSTSLTTTSNRSTNNSSYSSSSLPAAAEREKTATTLRRRVLAQATYGLIRTMVLRAFQNTTPPDDRTRLAAQAEAEWLASRDVIAQSPNPAYAFRASLLQIQIDTLREELSGENSPPGECHFDITRDLGERADGLLRGMEAARTRDGVDLTGVVTEVRKFAEGRLVRKHRARIPALGGGPSEGANSDGILLLPDPDAQELMPADRSQTEAAELKG